uniref:Transposase, YhgA-like n=1 Tax=Candidatus Kentrum sp. LPFa TaxID=2126335 RepID=A0A450WUR5_9GAMM|nr:MAG: Putative transposase, YhgA-like [Candidatus Kentron sp. LPFa]
MTKITQPHDHFMKELLSHPERAGTLLRERLPDEVTRFLSAKPPEPVPGSFVDEQLKEHRSDKLFQVETPNPPVSG